MCRYMVADSIVLNKAIVQTRFYHERQFNYLSHENYYLFTNQKIKSIEAA